MTSASAQSSTGQDGTAAEASGSAALERRPGTALVTPEGRTMIADTVVEKIAALAAREVSGVHAMGTGTARALGAVRDRLPGTRASMAQGVSVEVGERQAAIDLEIVIEYGVELAELTKAVRRNVIGSLHRMTALEVTEVNIRVNDVYVPGDEDDGADARVQ